jgi:hypothetical protein
MSAQLMGLVWDHAPYGASTLLTLLALADAADHAGQGSASLGVLAHLSRQSTVETNATLTLLEAAGVLTERVARRDASGIRLRYRLHRDALGDAGDRVPLDPRDRQEVR